MCTATPAAILRRPAIREAYRHRPRAAQSSIDSPSASNAPHYGKAPAPNEPNASSLRARPSPALNHFCVEAYVATCRQIQPRPGRRKNTKRTQTGAALHPDPVPPRRREIPRRSTPRSPKDDQWIGWNHARQRLAH